MKFEISENYNNNATKKILSYWKDLFDKNLKQKLNKLDNCIKDQNEFGQQMANIINNLDFKDPESKEKEEKKESSEADSSQSENQNEKSSISQKEKDKISDAELSVLENNLETSNENQEEFQKEVNLLTYL